jgi:3-hydroxymyristoyl/3-hydroxydecanoyl-(acyl carrier protein) dehydratase
MKHEIEQSIVEVHLDAEDGRVRAQLCFHADLTVFVGHFPEIKLVPGIYLLEATRVLAERSTGVALRIDEVTNCRFTAEVHPGDTVTAEAIVARDAGGITCEASFEMGPIKAAKVRLVLRAR